MIPEKLIDIESLFASKNPRLLKIIPGFVIRYLKHITHQDEINGYIYNHRDKVGLPFVEAMLKEFGVTIISNDLQSIITDHRSRISHPASRIPYPASRIPHPASRIPDLNDRFIIASNHPLGGLDGMALMQEVGRVLPDIVFPVNDLLMYVPGLRPLFIPINKHGRNTENAKIINDTFASDKTILYFPAGLVSRKLTNSQAHQLTNSPTHQLIMDLEWKKTFISKARKYQRDVIPVHISGQNSNWFYNLANWRKRLGIKANIEMLYLVDEMIRQKGQTIRITFGEPIPYTVFDKSKTDTQWAEMVRNKAYQLGVNSQFLIPNS